MPSQLEKGGRLKSSREAKETVQTVLLVMTEKWGFISWLTFCSSLGLSLPLLVNPVYGLAL